MFHTILRQWQPFLAVFVLLLFWTWESLAPFFARRGRVKHAARNIVVSLINGVAIALVFAGVTVLVAEYTDRNSIGLLHWLGLNGVAFYVLAFLFLDVWMYWWHRLNHLVPFFWRFHRMHHSDPEMDVTTATRFHVGEIVFSSIIKLLLILAFSIPIEVLIVYDFVQLPVISFHHANIALPRMLDNALAWFIVTPFMHKVHHSRVKPETDSNFSSLLSVWDRLFGSFVRKERYEEIQFGLDGFDAVEKQTVKGLLATPFFNR